MGSIRQMEMDLGVAKDARDDALARVARGAPASWLSAAMQAVLDVGAKGEFTADDVWDRLDERNVPRPAEPRALGAVLTAMARLKLVSKTGTYRATKRRSRHAAPIAVWKRVSP